MNNFFVIVVTGFFSICAYGSDCFDTAGTQLELNLCALSKANSAEARLNRVYKKILSSSKDDPEAAAAIRNAERAWIRFRDAQVKMAFPDRKEESYYGSVKPMCVDGYYQELTEARIKELNEFYKYNVDGEVCQRG